MKFILAKKLEMTQIFQDDGRVIPVTKVLAGPCYVVDKKDKAKDGYSAIKLAMEKVKSRNKPLKHFFEKILGKNRYYRYLREIRLAEQDLSYQQLKIGQELTVRIFQPGDFVKVTGISKGKGFQGGVKRHGFSGSPASHGHKDQLRMPGSIGAKGPAKVFKGQKMPGHMGVQRVTIKGLEIVQIEPEQNFLYIKGAVPGARNSLLIIQGEGEIKIQELKQEEGRLERIKEVKKIEKKSTKEDEETAKKQLSEKEESEKAEETQIKKNSKQILSSDGQENRQENIAMSVTDMEKSKENENKDDKENRKQKVEKK